ncbi:MAG: exosome complex protein Rrp42 [Candidatus Pacearchaeota archaeon]|nr:exosome complex protein Rrp42 [Candidatus Pacearchaeota archaeon]
MDTSSLTKKRIEELLQEGKRFDGRRPLDYRKIEIETGISKNAEGSARVKIGDTEVLVGVKLDVVEPFSDSPDSGALIVGAELLPLASRKFESGPPQIQAIELARIVDRGIRESEFIELKKLGIKTGEKVWGIFIDIYPLNDDGNLIDASALAAVAALKSAVFPVLKDDKVQYGEFTDKKLPLKKPPVTVTCYKIGNSFVLDPNSEEEETAKVRVTVAMTFDKETYIHALQKSGDEALSEEEIMEIIKIAESEGKKLLKRIE